MSKQIIMYPCVEGWDSQGYHSKHKALDFGWLKSESSNGKTPILACADGVIAYEGYYKETVYGKEVLPIVCIIRHDNFDKENTWYSVYWHLSRTIINIGDKVKMGDEIGLKGNTGYSTGVHLHFALLKCPLGFRMPNSYEFDKYAVNPIEYIRVFENQKFEAKGGNFTLKKYTNPTIDQSHEYVEKIDDLEKEVIMLKNKLEQIKKIIG